MNTDKLKAWYSGLEGNQKTNVLRFAVIGGVLLFSLIVYFASGRSEDKPPPPPQREVLGLDDTLLEDDIQQQIAQDREVNKRRFEQQDKRYAALQENDERVLQALTDLKGALDKDAVASAGEGGITPPPTSWEGGPIKAPPPPGNAEQAKLPPPSWEREGLQQVGVEPVYTGDIGHVQASEPTATSAENTKKKRLVHLPPGFMEAQLLTGLRAKTVEGASSNPEPMWLRVQAPAILPNEVRANLEGCFVIAHGYGSLASERIEARLVSLNCIDPSGRSVIEEPIKGVVIDGDGIKGIAGRPVWRGSTVMSRAMIAGIAEGFGEGIAEQAGTTTTSPLGTVSTIDKASDAFEKGMGRGISLSSQELKKIYVELIQQSAPVVETGPSKKVTVALTEGVDLEIKEVNHEG